MLILTASMLQWGWMFVMPAEYQQMVETQINDFDPVIKAGSIETFTEQEYNEDALNYSVYQGLYQRGVDGFGPWEDGNVPEWGPVRDELQGEVSSVLASSYIGAIGSGSDCTLNRGSDVAEQFDAETVGSGDDSMTFIVLVDEGPWFLECEALRIDLRSGGLQTMTVKEVLNVPSDITAPKVRYRDMHEVAADFAQNEEFHEMLNTAEKSAAIAVARGCPNEDSSTCGYSPPSDPTLSDDLINEQEDMVGSRLEEELTAAFEDEYSDRDYRLHFETKEVEYGLTYQNTLDDQYIGSWITGCGIQSDFGRYTTWPGSVCGESCPSDEDCPLSYPSSDGFSSCSGGRLPGLSSCDDIRDASYTAPNRAEDAGSPANWGEYWTENPWEVTSGEACDGFTYSDPYQFGGSQDIAFRDSQLRPETIVTRGTSHFNQCGGCGPYETCFDDECVCTSSCSAESSDHTCTENLGTEANTQNAWEFGIASTTVVTVTVNDTRNRIPTENGYRHPLFRFAYTQENERLGPGGIQPVS